MQEVNRPPLKLFSRRETAEMLGISAVTLWRHYRNGVISCRRIGGKVMFDESDIREYVSRAKQPALAEAEM